jgi:outer membrane murein-binding lipoprotein Lpp
MGYQFRIVPEIEQWAGRLSARLRNAWGGRPDREARRALGKIGFWIAQPSLDAACQRQLVAFRLSRWDVADVATAVKQLELQIAQLEQQADEPGRQDAAAGQGSTTEQIAVLRRRHADLLAKEEQVTAVSRRLMAEINALRDGKEAVKAAYAAAEAAAKAVWRR